MIQSGDPEGTGKGGESIWGGKFEDEFCPNLNNFRGALSMANAGRDTNGAFFIVQAGRTPGRNPSSTRMTASSGIILTRCPVKSRTSTWKSAARLSWTGPTPRKRILPPATGSGHTVFGQVFEGMVWWTPLPGVEMMAQKDDLSTEINESTTPKEDVIIEKIEIVEYHA